MAKLIQYIHKTIIIAFCFALIAILMVSVSHFIHRQQTELSDSLQNFGHRLIKQSTYSLGPLINRYSTDDNNQPIADVLHNLSQQPWIIDVSVYQINGALIAQAGENVSVRERLALDESASINKNTTQLLEKIDLAGSPVGFIRLTIDPSALAVSENGVNYTIKIVWIMLTLAVSLGFILALTLVKYPLVTGNTSRPESPGPQESSL